MTLTLNSVREKISDVQKRLAQTEFDGWLMYDFRRCNELACTFLEIPAKMLLSRRFFYWIPKEGEPVKIVHAIEQHTLTHLPGKVESYQTKDDLEKALKNTLGGMKHILMEYSPMAAIPTVSKVDAGTLELVKSFGPEVSGSADMLQVYTAVLTERQWEMHKEAADFLDRTVEKVWSLIAGKLGTVTEHDVRQFILKEMAEGGFATQDPPLCAVNENSANPHYDPPEQGSVVIRKNDFILIDLWCKKNEEGGVYADITRVGAAASEPGEKHQKIFEIVREARDSALKLVQSRFEAGEPVEGWEADQCARDVVNQAGYGDYFIHRTGHNIGEKDHGDGANLDNYETRDKRRLLPGTCFSIEPGIYLPGEFGVRLEYDVYVDKKGQVHVTGGIQNRIACIV